MSKLFIHDIEVQGKHGVFLEEHTFFQKFLISIEVEFDGTQAEQTDQLEDTLDYSQMIALLVQETTQCSFHLIERLARHLADTLFQAFPPITHIHLIVKKFPEGLSQYTYQSLGYDATFYRP